MHFALIPAPLMFFKKALLIRLQNAINMQGKKTKTCHFFLSALSPLCRSSFTEIKTEQMKNKTTRQINEQRRSCWEGNGDSCIISTAERLLPEEVHQLNQDMFVSRRRRVPFTLIIFVSLQLLKSVQKGLFFSPSSIPPHPVWLLRADFDIAGAESIDPGNRNVRRPDYNEDSRSFKMLMGNFT